METHSRNQNWSPIRCPRERKLASRSKVKALQREVVFPQPGLSVLGFFGPYDQLVELPLEIFKVLEQGTEPLLEGGQVVGDSTPAQDGLAER